MAFCVYVRHGEQTHAVELDPGASVRDLLAAAAASTGLDDVRGRLIHGGTHLKTLDMPLADTGIGAEAVVVFHRGSDWYWDPDWGAVASIEAGKVVVDHERESSRSARLLPPIHPGSTERVALRFGEMTPSGTRVGLCADYAKDLEVQITVPDIVGNGVNPSGIGICASKDVTWHFAGSWPNLQRGQEPHCGDNFHWEPHDVIVCTVDRVQGTFQLQRMMQGQGELSSPVIVMSNLPTDILLYFVVCFYDDADRSEREGYASGSARIVEIVEDFC
eukprot:TRINITY_DN4491_c0_g1_i1.p1 TRINITY_DN4491_c0_g1~~TRINITY_DN4491_c0_g1_i1.p1  ORF type:complete len:300 (+),score=46.20 TRINITY_DN4491_c0_g1_i1:76-900(+)